MKVAVSVIIPIYNGAPFIDRCLDAVLVQDFDDYEVICIDDGSTDGTYDILMSRREPNLRCFKQENTGVWYARQRGLSEACGQYIMFCDCDDKPAPNWISTMFKKAVSADADITVCGFRRVDSISGRMICEEMTLSGVIDTQGDKIQLAFINSSLWNKLYKAEILHSIYKPVKPPRLAEDALFLTSIFPTVSKVAFVPDVLYDYHLHGSSAYSRITKEDFELTREAFKGLAKIYPQELLRLLTCMTVLHWAVLFSMYLRTDARAVIKETYMFIKENFPGWKKAVTICDVLRSKYRRKMIKVYLAFLLYRVHLFGIFVSISQFMSDRFGVTLKW
jgi:glycosyltransferase involved in cell wall biosynthesis